MSKSGSRYGRRSNWFKIHCLLQEQQQQAGANIAAAASLLRPHPYLAPLFHNRTPQHRTVSRETKSSESDSGASSADPEDESRSSRSYSYVKPRDECFSMKNVPSPASDSECFDRRKFISAIVNAPSVSPSSLPSISPVGNFSKWLPSFPALNDPLMWRDLWAKGPFTHAATAPDQVEPIDLSMKTTQNEEVCIDVGDNEPIKPVPLDLTLERQTTDVTH